MKKEIKVCCGRKCLEKGAERLYETLKNELKSEEAHVGLCSCVGYCEQGPNVVADEKIYHLAKPKDIVERIEKDDGVMMEQVDLDDLLEGNDLV